MATRHALTGARARRAVALLKQVAGVLENAGIRYWLDSGTLLGIVREGRLLPWDTDMDVSVPEEYLPELLNVLPELRRAGLRIDVRRHLADHSAFSKGDVRLIKVRNRKWRFFRGDLLLDVFVLYAHGDYLHWAIRRKDTQQQYVGRAPVTLLDNLKRVNFEGHDYAIPAKCEEYLTWRYGDWRTPREKWCCFTDDLTVEAVPDVSHPVEQNEVDIILPPVPGGRSPNTEKPGFIASCGVRPRTAVPLLARIGVGLLPRPLQGMFVSKRRRSNLESTDVLSTTLRAPLNMPRTLLFFLCLILFLLPEEAIAAPGIQIDVDQEFVDHVPACFKTDAVR